MDNTTKVFCEDCRYCRPDRSILSLFELSRGRAYHLAKCVANKGESLHVNTYTHTRKKDFYYCFVINPEGTCKAFEQKVR